MEIWKDIPGFEGAYQISDLGNVRSLDRWVTVKSKLGKERKLFVKGGIKLLRIKLDGYLYTGLNIKGKHLEKAVHRLVAESFLVSDIKGKDVDHIDGNGLNNKVSNLRVCNRNNNLTFRNVNRKAKRPYVGVMYKGVSKYGTEKWITQIWHPIEKRGIVVNGFTTPEAAHEEYRRLRILLYGDDISIQEQL